MGLCLNTFTTQELCYQNLTFLYADTYVVIVSSKDMSISISIRVILSVNQLVLEAYANMSSLNISISIRREFMFMLEFLTSPFTAYVYASACVASEDWPLLVPPLGRVTETPYLKTAYYLSGCFI